MILFPLMTTWIWLHFLTASSFLTLSPIVGEPRDGDISLRPVRFDGDRT
jgi:hypothetical protein